MKADNIFKFVSLRSPQSDEVVIRIKGDEKAKKRIDDEFENAKKQKGTKDEQGNRLLVGSNIIQSEYYFGSSQEGQILVSEWRLLRDFLETLSEPADYSTFTNDFRKFFKDITSDSLATFLKSERYSSLKERLWTSYYGLTLNPNERPQDREIVIDWLRAFYLADSPNEKTFGIRAKSIGRVRPSVPFAWFRPSAGRAEPTPTSKPEAVGHLELDKRLKSFETARKELQLLFQAKARKHQSFRIETAPPRPDEVRGSSVGGIDLSQHDPAKVTSADIENNSEIFGILRREGLDFETSLLPDLINELDLHIARLSAETREMARKEEVTLSGNSFVRIKRLTPDLLPRKDLSEVKET